MVKVISQETFDAVVKENMEEFEMAREDAIKEAIAQFESQGVNLANIVTSATENEDHAIAIALKKLELGKDLSEDDVIAHCSTIKSECGKGLAEKMLATKNKGYAILTETALKKEASDDVVVAAVNALGVFLRGNPDPFDEQGFAVIMQSLEDAKKKELVAAGLELVLSACIRHEQNRQNLVKNNILDHLDRVYDDHSESVALIWQALVQDDDVRVPYGKAHENAREIVEEHGALKKLLSNLKESSEPSLFLSCLSSLTVRNEYCQSVADNGGLESLLNLLSDHDQKASVLKEALLFLKTLAGNDNIKQEIRATQKIGVIVTIMLNHLSNKGVSHAGCSVIAAICLRTPDNAQQVMDAGGAEALVQVLKTHMTTSKVAVAAINAMRNIVSRAKHLTEAFVRLGVEELLNQTLAQHPQVASVNDSVKAALRDMNLKVHLKEEWKGAASPISA